MPGGWYRFRCKSPTVGFEFACCRAGEYVIALPVLVAMKAALHNAMIETGTRKADLARKLGQKAPQIDRLLDVEHSSKVETVELALHQLNKTVNVNIE